MQLSEGELSAIHNAICSLETRWIPGVSSEGREGSHPAVSYPLWLYLRGMALARDYFRERLVGYGAQPRFLDVGCGIGTKVLLAQQMNFEADGLDFVPEYCEAARELCGSLSTIHDADAREFDKYGDYDLIYAYRPLVEEAETAWLTGWIAEQLKPGSLMFLAWWPEVQTDSLHKMSEAIYVRTAAG